jgi:hypothetical protein
VHRFTLKNIALFAVVAGLALAPAFAKTEGSLNGVVKDGQGAPLPGVTVKIESPGLLGGSRSTTTDAQGNYRFPAIPPGTYKLSAELFGFKKFEQDGIQIQINQPSSFNPVLSVEGVEIGIEVRAHEDIVQAEKTQTSTALNNEFVDNIPVLGRAYQNLLLLAPGVTMGDSFFGGNPTSHGARSDANQYLFDGGNTTDTALGTFGQNFNQDAVDQIEVITAGYKAEFGRSDGAIANVLTKSGGNDFEGSFRFDVRDSAFDKHGSGKQGIQDQDFYRRYYSATFGGPFIKDRFLFFLAAYYQDRNDVFQDDGTPYPVQDAPAELWDYFAKLSYQINDDHQLVFSWHFDPATFHNADVSGYMAPSARTEQYQQGHVWLLKETAVFSPNVFLESLINVVNDNEIEVGPDSDAPASTDPFNGYDTKTKTYYGRTQYDVRTNRDRSQFREDLSVYIDDAMGTHDLKFGVGYELENDFELTQTIEYYTLQNGVFTSKEYPSDDPRFPVGAASHTRLFSVYAQDSWSPREGLTLNLGVRLDRQELEYNGHGPGYPRVIDDPTFTFDQVHRSIEEIDDMGVAPRLGFSWDPMADGKNVIRGSASRFYTTIPGFAGTWDRGTYAVGFSCDTDPQGNCVATEEPEPLYYYFLDKNLKMPYTDEYTIGYEREIIPEFALGITGIWREGTDLLQDIDPNTFFTDENGDGVAETRNRRNPNFNRPVFVLTNDDRSEYIAVEVSARKRLADNWQLLGSYTYSKAEGDGEWAATAEGDDARLDGDEFAYLTYDQRHVLKLDGTYFLPLDFIVSASVRYQTGTPYSINVKQFSDFDGDGIPDPGETPSGSPTGYYGDRNSERNDNYWNLDLRGEKDFVFKGITVGVFADVFNVLNDQSTVATEKFMEDDGLGTITTTSETKRFGRRFQLGFRINF